MKVVLCHGVFDLLHRGHISHFREAKKYGDRLVVSVVADKYVHKPHRMMVNKQDARLELVAAVRYVDDAVLCEAPGPEDVIERLRPDVYVMGPDKVGKTMPEEELLLRLGIPVRYSVVSFPRTTEIIERIQRVATAKQG